MSREAEAPRPPNVWRQWRAQRVHCTPGLGGSLTWLRFGGFESALNRTWELEWPKARGWVQVVLAGLVDNAQPRLGVAGDRLEKTIDLPDLERSGTCCVVDADDEALWP